MKQLFFSIITCTSNSEKYISKNLDSVNSQSFTDYEQIIIDGNSIDKTIEIVKNSQKNNPRINIFSYPPKGVSNAFNMGISNSHGKYLLFLNSDDYFFDKYVLKDVNLFLRENPDLDWIYGKINVIEQDGKKVGVFPSRKIFQTANHYLLKFFNYIPHQSVFIKKEIFKKFGNFDTSLKSNMDRDLWFRISPKTKWIFFDRIISNYTLRKGSISSDIEHKDRGLKTIEKVDARYLNRIEIVFSKIINRFINLFNRTYR